jgi:transcriptional regulator with XRE-family HTH domain
VVSGLGEYLRSRRALLSTDRVGLATGGGARRVPGLRREEVAVLAGISADYYMRLEQGRERHPSAQVLDALARALRLDDDARRHLHQIAGAAVPQAGRAASTRVDPLLQRLVDGWREPALVYNRAFDLLAANPVAELLFDGHGALAELPGSAAPDVCGCSDEGPRLAPLARNLVHEVFLDARARELYVDWADVADSTVGTFRLLHGEAPDDPRVRQVVAHLLERSPEFRVRWERHDVLANCLPPKRLRHPEVGLLTVYGQAFDVRGAPGQALVVYTAEPGSVSAGSLDLLGALAADRAAPVRRAHA